MTACATGTSPAESAAGHVGYTACARTDLAHTPPCLLHHRTSYYCVKDGADFTVMSELMTAEADLGINTYSTAVWANTAQTKHTATPGMKVSQLCKSTGIHG